MAGLTDLAILLTLMLCAGFIGFLIGVD